MGGSIGRQADRQTDTDRHRQTDRQTDRYILFAMVTTKHAVLHAVM